MRKCLSGKFCNFYLPETWLDSEQLYERDETKSLLIYETQ